MQRVMDPNTDFFTSIKDSYNIARNRPTFDVFPQMPMNQIQHFIKQAVRKNKEIVIQMNPSPLNRQMNEIQGSITLSHRSSHVILTTKDKQMVHLVRPQLIRHLRLA